MFTDRKDAAIQLAEALNPHRNTNALVLGIPRGGAETAYYVARELQAELSLLVARKLGHPKNPEYAVGALAEDGSIYLNPDVRGELSPQTIENLAQQQQEEIKRRISILRQGEPLPPLKNRVVILVDDGIATGATLYAAIALCKKQGAARIVVAAPVSGRDKKRELLAEADEVVVLETPAFYRSVSQAYESFYNLTDEEAKSFLERWQKERATEGSTAGTK